MITFNPTTLSLDFVNNVGVINGEDYSLDPARTSGRVNAFTNGIITLTRAGVATRINSSGLIENVAANTPRFDYDPVTLQPKGLLIEESRTNLLTYSEQFDNIAWSKAAATVTTNSAIAPDGSTTADTLTASAGTDLYHRVTRLNTVISGSTQTYSVYLKQGTNRYAIISLIGNIGVGSWAAVVVDLLSGIITQTSNGSTSTSVSSSIVSLGSGWYRASITAICGTDTSIATDIRVSNTGTPTFGNYATYSWTATGSETILIWGAQLETGQFVSSYIPTTSSSVTRSADACTMTGTNFSSWYKQNAGTFLTSIIPTFVDTNITPQFTVLEIPLNTTNYLQLFCSTVGTRIGTPNFRIRNNILVSNELSSLSFVSGQIAKIAGAFSVSDITTAMNGSVATSTTVTLGTMPTPTSASFGNSSTVTSSINGHLRSVQFYPTRLPDSVLQSLTA